MKRKRWQGWVLPLAQLTFVLLVALAVGVIRAGTVSHSQEQRGDEIRRAQEIKVGTDGRYSLPADKDGCVWTEVDRGRGKAFGQDNVEVIALGSACPVEFGYAYFPALGRLERSIVEPIEEVLP